MARSVEDLARILGVAPNDLRCLRARQAERRAIRQMVEAGRALVTSAGEPGGSRGRRVVDGEPLAALACALVALESAQDLYPE